MSGGPRIVLTGGGTGGHVYPALAVASAADRGTRFVWVGTPTGMERDLVGKTDIPFEAVPAGAVRGRAPLTVARSLCRIVQGIAVSMRVFRRFRPDVVLATGGFVCVPVVLAARLAGVPSVIYLPDLRPGWAVAFLSRLVNVVAVTAEEVVPLVPARRVVVTGYPVRPELARWSRPEARRFLGLPESAPVVLVVGASQGARRINLVLARDLTRLLQTAHVVHSTGSANYEEMVAVRAALPDDLKARYHLYPFLDVELAPAMAAADLMVGRSGASSLGEIPAVGVPAILIPYPFAGAHQRHNADYLAERGAAVALDDAEAGQMLVSVVLDLLADGPRRAAMSTAARRLARPDAARRLFELVSDVASTGAAIAARR